MLAKVTTLLGLASGTDTSGRSLLDLPVAEELLAASPLVPSEGDQPPTLGW